jgi:hypothetical protein
MKLGVPKGVAMTPKRATQYSSGTSKMLGDSIRQHVDEFRNLSKKGLQAAVQEFLYKLKIE